RAAPSAPGRAGHVHGGARAPRARGGGRRGRLHHQGRLRPGPGPGDRRQAVVSVSPKSVTTNGSGRVRMLLVDGDFGRRAALVTLLDADAGIEVVGLAGGGAEATRLTERL